MNKHTQEILDKYILGEVRLNSTASKKQKQAFANAQKKAKEKYLAGGNMNKEEIMNKYVLYVDENVKNMREIAPALDNSKLDALMKTDFAVRVFSKNDKKLGGGTISAMAKKFKIDKKRAVRAISDRGTFGMKNFTVELDDDDV